MMNFIIFQGEAVRMARQLPQRLNREEALDILNQLTQTMGKDITECFHKLPILKPMYNMEELPPSQESDS